MELKKDQVLTEVKTYLISQWRSCMFFGGGLKANGKRKMFPCGVFVCCDKLHFHL